MADKTWTATDVQMGKLSINVIDGVLFLDRRYQFVDGSGDVLPIQAGRVTAEVAWADVPQDIRAALVDINDWTKNQALAQEGMA